MTSTICGKPGGKGNGGAGVDGFLDELLKNKDACETYAECYTTKKKEQFDSNVVRVKREETDRKAEWRGLKRIECLINAFKDGRITDAEVNACTGKTHGTDHLI